jgi:RimJ/RimL family protein N-acetyltransferase
VPGSLWGHDWLDCEIAIAGSRFEVVLLPSHARPWLGRGPTVAGPRLLTEWVIAERGAVRVQLEADARHGASRAVALKAGYVEEGVLRAAGVQRGEHIDIALYSVIATRR